MVSTLPPLIMMLVGVDRDHTELTASGHFVYLIQLLRLFKVSSLGTRLRWDFYTDAIIYNFSISAVTFKMILLFLIIYFIAHLIACLWWALCTLISFYAWYDDPSMVYETDLRFQAVYDQYLFSIYWTFTTITTVGYGDIHPINTNERIVCIFIVVLGVSIFGYAVARINQLNKSTDPNACQLSMIKDYLKNKNCSYQVSEKIMNHYNFYYNQTSRYDEQLILSVLPTNISNDILLIKNKKVIERIPLFRFIDNQTVILYICSCLVPEIYNRDQCIVQQDTVADGLYFLISGEAKSYKSLCKINDSKKHRSNTIMRSITQSFSMKKLRSLSVSYLNEEDNINKLNSIKFIGNLYPGSFFGHIPFLKKSCNKVFTPKINILYF